MFPTAQRQTELHKQIRLNNDYTTRSVRECFYWPKHISNSYKVEHRADAKAPKNYYQKPQTKPTVRFSDELDEWDGRYSDNGNESTIEFNNHNDDESTINISSDKPSPNTVLSALRGWPKSRSNEENLQTSYTTNEVRGVEDGDTRIYEGQMNGNNIIASNSLPDYTFESDCDYVLDDGDNDVIFYDYESEKNKNTTNARSNNKDNNAIKNNRGDATIRDLLSYRYHREHKIEESREKKEDEQRERQKSKERFLKNKRMASLKANKTSQLRAIELSKRATNEAKNEEMWKMKKFREVQSKISSLKSEKQKDNKINTRVDDEDEQYSHGLQVNYKEELDDITYKDYNCDEDDILDFDSLRHQLYVS